MTDHLSSHGAGRGTGALVGFVLGTAVGAGVALLLAPASGAETRRRLGETSRRLSLRMRDGVHLAHGRLGELKEDVVTAVATGREAFARERDARGAPLNIPRES